MIEGDFGGTIKRSRDRLGLSQARVAELVGRSPSTIRSWEHGKSAPTDAGTITSLAAVLALDEAVLLRAAGVQAPTPRSQLTIEQILSEIAPTNLAPVAPREPGIDPVPEYVRVPKMRAVDSTPPRMQPSIRGKHQRFAAALQTSERLSVLPPPPVQELSYVEDPSQRLLYRLRTVLTAIGVVLTLVLLVWAYGEATDAFGTMWDILTENL